MENKAGKHDHACSECGKRLLNKHSLQLHVREVHKKKREGTSRHLQEQAFASTSTKEFLWLGDRLVE